MMRLPSYDIHFKGAAHKGYYQRQTLLLTMAHAHKWTVALDIGAHVGFTANDLAKFFNVVHAFEPQPDNYSCLLQNAAGNVVPHNVAIGGHPGRIGLHSPKMDNSGAWEMCEGDDVEMATIDSFDFGDVGLMKIDVQGGEMGVLRGAKETIIHFQPTMQVELPKVEIELLMNDDKLPEACKFLMELGANPVARVRQDMIFSW